MKGLFQKPIVVLRLPPAKGEARERAVLGKNVYYAQYISLYRRYTGSSAKTIGSDGGKKVRNIED